MGSSGYFSFLLIGHCNDLVLVSQLSIEKRSNALCAFFGFFLGGGYCTFYNFCPLFLLSVSSSLSPLLKVKSAYCYKQLFSD